MWQWTVGTIDEIAWLLVATAAGPERYKILSDERAVLYSLTLGRYTQTKLGERSEAAARLPDLVELRARCRLVGA